MKNTEIKNTKITAKIRTAMSVLVVCLLLGLAACSGMESETEQAEPGTVAAETEGMAETEEMAGMTEAVQPQAEGETEEGAESEMESGAETTNENEETNILIAYLPDAGAVSSVAETLRAALGGDLMEIGNEAEGGLVFGSYEFILLGFEAQGNVLPEAVQAFLAESDMGARTIYPFAAGEGNSEEGIFSAISELQPGALMGGSALLLDSGAEAEAQEQEIEQWAESLGLSDEGFTPLAGEGNTVATATVTPDAQQVLYLWEEGNALAVTEYTVNNGGYFDDPDFRPYITSFPVPEGTEVKGAVLICPGGAFQFRSDQPEGVDVAEALSALGYQSFVVDYRLRPYTQQEGALDLDYEPDALDRISADAAACGMIYSFYGRLSVGTTDVELLRSGELPPTFYCYGTRDPFYDQFLANADAAEEAGVEVERLQLDDMPHGFGARGGWIPAYDEWLSAVFEGN